jgi:uncharacterized protein YbcI
MSDVTQANAWTAPAEQSPSRNDELTAVCGAVAAVFRRAWGRGPVRTTAHWAGRNMLVVLLENGHTEAEKTMRAAGHIQELMGGRRLLQVLIEDDLKASVEHILQRPVETTLSATRLDPDLSVEVFLLGNAMNGVRYVEDRSLTDRTRKTRERSHELGDEARALESQHPRNSAALPKRER